LKPSEVRPVEIAVDGTVLRGLLHRAAGGGGKDAPCIVLCHGLLSSMESPKFSLLADTFSREGFHTVRFDFRGCGSSGGNLRETTVSGRVRDLNAVLDYLRQSEGFHGPTGLLGSSMGGFVALLTFLARGDVQALCVWATPFRLDLLSSRRGHPDLDRLGPDFFEDLAVHDLRPRCGELHHLLLLHGGQDEVVPVNHGFLLYRYASPPKALEIIPQADHRFSDPEHRRQATERSLAWFRAHLIEAEAGTGPLKNPLRPSL